MNNDWDKFEDDVEEYTNEDMACIVGMVFVAGIVLGVCLYFALN